MNRALLRMLPLALLPLLAGCNPGGLFVVENRQDIQLLNALLRLTELPRQFVSTAPQLTVQGNTVKVCVVLAVNVELPVSTKMTDELQKQLNDHLNGAQLKAVLKMDDGSEHVLDAQDAGWHLMGRKLPEKHLYACAQPGCNTRLTIGGKVASMGLSATRPVNVQGVYWQSFGKPWESGVVKPARC
jgi:hypothetical protein